MFLYLLTFALLALSSLLFSSLLFSSLLFSSLQSTPSSLSPPSLPPVLSSLLLSCSPTSPPTTSKAFQKALLSTISSLPPQALSVAVAAGVTQQLQLSLSSPTPPSLSRPLTLLHSTLLSLSSPPLPFLSSLHLLVPLLLTYATSPEVRVDWETRAKVGAVVRCIVDLTLEMVSLPRAGGPFSAPLGLCLPLSPSFHFVSLFVLVSFPSAPCAPEHIHSSFPATSATLKRLLLFQLLLAASN